MDILNNDYLTIATSIVTLASFITNYTNTPKDDNVLKKIYSIIEFFAMVNYKAKDK
jgi:hypothetical protein